MHRYGRIDVRGKGEKKIEISQLAVGPVRHSSLTPDLLARIEGIARVFSEVDERPGESWVEDFQRDQNPEKEVVIWEAMAAAYSVFTRNRSLSPEAKKEAFGLLLMRSMNDERRVLKQAPLKHLSQATVAALLAVFKNVAGAEGWWIE